MNAPRQNRTFICSVLFLDIVEYSKKLVAAQIRVKERLNTLLTDALKDVAQNDRIILDTGDGVALNFIGNPEDALFVSMSLRDNLMADTSADTARMRRVESSTGLALTVRRPMANALQLLTVKDSRGDDPETVARRLRQDPRVADAVPDRWLRLHDTTPNDSDFANQLPYMGSLRLIRARPPTAHSLLLRPTRCRWRSYRAVGTKPPGASPLGLPSLAIRCCARTASSTPQIGRAHV